jgi:hypothetical protein
MKIDNEIIEILAKRFILTSEQAKDIYIAYSLTGSCDEGVKTVSELYGVGKEVVRRVFEALDDLYHNPEYNPNPDE